MPDRLTLIKIPEVISLETPNKPSPSLLNMERVVGITLPGSKTLLEYGWRLRGTETEEELIIGNSVENIADFYEQCMVVSPENAPFYNCFIFAYYALVETTRLQAEYTRIDHSLVAPVSTDSLEPGLPYGVMFDGEIAHSMLGTNNPTQNLGIICNLSPLFVSRNTEVLNAYGHEIQQYEPIAIV